jgi:hypothetical protein
MEILIMKKSLKLSVVAIFGAIGLWSSMANAADLVTFDQGIGVKPVSNVTGMAPDLMVKANVVRGVMPAEQIWVIRGLNAVVNDQGMIAVHGHGLLLGGGDNIATNGKAYVFATLICENEAPFVERSTTVTGVPVMPNGNFWINDVLTPAPTECAYPALLIRSAATYHWFAAGIPMR